MRPCAQNHFYWCMSLTILKHKKCAMKQGEQQALHDVICPLSFFDAENVKQNKAYHAGHISLYP